MGGNLLDILQDNDVLTLQNALSTAGCSFCSGHFGLCDAHAEVIAHAYQWCYGQVVPRFPQAFRSLAYICLLTCFQ